MTDEPAEGMLLLKPDWDKFTTISKTESSGIDSDLGDIQDDVTLYEAAILNRTIRKNLKENEDLSMN